MASYCGGLSSTRRSAVSGPWRSIAWATIVLLGGFSTLIKQKDFLFVTIISFLEATRLFSSAVDPEDQFIINAPEVVAAKTEEIEAKEQGSWQRHHPTNNQTAAASAPPRRGGLLGWSWPSSLTSGRRRRRFCTCRLFFAKALSTGFTSAQFAAAITSVVLAVLRLSRQDYVEPADQSSSDHKSIKGSLNLFYGLVLAQGVSNFLADTMLPVDVRRVLKLSMTYQLGHSGVLVIKRYMLDTYMKCSGGRVREAMDMDLVSFAMEMARSTSVADRLVGVRVLDRVLSVDKYRGLALMRLRASIDTVGSVIAMLGLKNKTTEEEDTRGHAANVVLELSPDLQVESFPEVLQMVSSLLTATKTTAVSSSTSSNVGVELTWLGVKILKKIMDNPDNCKEVVKDADDQVISSIVELTTVSDDTNSSSISWSPVTEEIIVEAVQVLHRMVRTTGDAGKALRCKISENLHVVRNIRKILEHPRSHTELLTEAIGVLACLALDETGKEDIGGSARIIRRLVPFLVVETPSPSNRVELAKSAVEALLILAVDSQRIALRILEEMRTEDMQQLVDMLSSDSTELRIMAARLLAVLRANSLAEHAHYNRTVDNVLPLVNSYIAPLFMYFWLLKAIKLEVEKLDALVPAAGELRAHDDELIQIICIICTQNLEEWRTKQGALLESFIGLSVQICTFIQENDFGDALRNANLTVDLLMHKLTRILDLYKSPDTEYPGIRRVTVELIIWMVRSNRSCIEFFFEHQVDKVKEVAETEARLEMFKMFCCGVGVAKHRETISSLCVLY
ncbi:uncharacterized protein LOC8065967 [Sorghum bicolor]|uniref:uncharacterized protein LOC8065967 n=1 Tax=Sorghum bicolor TaxID=4558 RepID=UPI000B423F09|nr:uncharacterized protein LOC8065967 [Sorghum bicolor]|eukprot:XP_002447430.2 uncharacterized protein LOC8065967 [Sorghum bicolor]